MLKNVSSEAAGKTKPQAYPTTPTHPKRAETRCFPCGYVEDFVEPRTKLGMRRLGAPGAGRV
jgi:hypothetical protein